MPGDCASSAGRYRPPAAGSGWDGRRPRTRAGAALLARCALTPLALSALGLAALALAPPLRAQGPSMPSTLRYGSGLLDVPVASVLPHMRVSGTYSGFFMNLGSRVELDADGSEVGLGPGVDRFFSDGSLTVGLFDRLEVGTSLQSLAEESSGGNVWGIFGRLRLWRPIDQGLGLAVGARYLTSPGFGDGADYAPGRLGFADARLRARYAGMGDIDTNLSVYGVATAFLRGFDGGRLPANDMTFTLGYGTGMFQEGSALGYYGEGSSGWFAGAGVHVGLTDASLLSLMAEYNGFDVNVGAQVDVWGLRLGAHYLALNHARPPGGYASEYRKPKLGVLGSISICPNESGFRCRPRMMVRTEPDTIWIPPPPPDTVLIATNGAAPPVAEGEPATMCLSTGQNVELRITERGDTLIGPDRVPISTLRPVVAFAGSYAAGAFWFESGRVVVFEGADYGKSDDPFPIDCGQILRVGLYEGVPVFAVVTAERPLVMIFIPVRPGWWQRYERGVR
jgi:hypothetical protein